jgi:quercetin dioxygenase-like cupin family protein
MAHDKAAQFIRYGDVDWAVESPSGVPAELLEAAAATGARRKKLVTGQSGFFMNYSELPAGFTVPTHTHNHDEIIVILSGGCTVLDGGPTLGPKDTLAITADFAYGFVCGPEGMNFMTIRAGEASTELDKA